MRGAVAVWRLQLEADVVVVEPFEPLVRDRRPGEVTAEALEPVTVTSADGDIGVKVETVRPSAARAELLRRRRAEQSSEPAGWSTCRWPERGSSGQRPAVALAERGIVRRNDGLSEALADLLGPDEKDWPEGADEFTGWTLEATVEAVPVMQAP